VVVCCVFGEWREVVCLESGERVERGRWRVEVGEWRLERGERLFVVCLESRERSFVWRSVSEWRVCVWI
jgi:hypothetical protein